MTLSQGLNIALWFILVGGAVVYWSLPFFERARGHVHTTEFDHVILSRTGFLVIVLAGAGVFSATLDAEGRELLASVLIALRAVAIALTWTLVLHDIDRVRRHR